MRSGSSTTGSWIDPAHPDAEDRDRFILSKGHGPASLYAILAAKGFFPPSARPFLDHDGRLGSDPDRMQVPGIEASTGSLGHGFPMAVGVAQAFGEGRPDHPVVILTGDAELNEGSNWEAVMLAPKLRLGNLTWLIVDNHSSSWPMGPWDTWLPPFGWDVRVVDGHVDDASRRRSGFATRNSRWRSSRTSRRASGDGPMREAFAATATDLLEADERWPSCWPTSA